MSKIMQFNRPNLTFEVNGITNIKSSIVKHLKINLMIKNIQNTKIEKQKRN